MELELFASQQQLARAEQQLAQCAPAERSERVVELAWHLRQRDRKRALGLINEVQIDPGNEGHDVLQARMLLIRAEFTGLDGDHALAREHAQQARAIFMAQSDEQGVGDSLWLEGMTWGLGEREDELLERASAAYERGGDVRRVACVMLRRCFQKCFQNLQQARDMMAQSGLDVACDAHPGVQTWLHAAKASIHIHAEEFAASAVDYLHGYDAAIASGQVRMASLLAGSLGAGFNSLNDPGSNLEWQEKALRLAEQVGSRNARGSCLRLIGNALMSLKRHDEAQRMLEDALQSQAEGSHNWAITVFYLGKVALAMGQHERSLHWLDLATQQQSLGQTAILNAALLTRAKVYRAQGDLVQAVQAAQSSLTHAQEHALPLQQGKAHYELGLILSCDGHAGQPLGEGSADALRHFEEAVRISRSIANHTVDPEWMEALAAEHFRRGDGATAYQVALEAGRAREHMQGQEVKNRAVALEVRFETEKLRAQAGHLRAIGQAAAERVRLMQEANSTLEELGAVGREITTKVDVAGVCEVLERRVGRLVDAATLGVYLLDDAGLNLDSVLRVERGEHLPARRIAIDDPQARLARCVRERTPLVEHVARGQTVTQHLPGTLPTLSLMSAPLVVGDRVLGAMTIQSTELDAYGERERALFDSLCAYTAIALANAQARQALIETNRELALMANTDRLTGLYNRRYLDSVLERENGAAQRHGKAYSIVMIDVDHFKSVNDEFGHPMGDAVLAGLALILRQRVRGVDVAGRWGGEEFMIISPNTAQDEAANLAEAVRLLMQGHRFKVVGCMTASFGVACWQAGDTVAGLVARADDALYAAKRLGRNRVELA